MMRPPKRKIFDVVGEAATNAAGRKRQDVLCDVEPGDPVVLAREPHNAYDPNAIAVTVDGETVGYIPRNDAAILAPLIDAGRSHTAIVHCIRGGVPDAPHYGCEVSIAWDGAKQHPYRPLDDVQRKSRAGKAAIRGRERDEQGRLMSSRSGCSVIFVLIIAIGWFGSVMY